MKKKLLTLLTLLIMCVTGAWAQNTTITLSGSTTKDAKTTAMTPTISTSNSAIITLGKVASTCATSGYIITTGDGKTFKYNDITYYHCQPYEGTTKKYWKDAGANIYGTFTIPSGYSYTIKGVTHVLAAQSSNNFKATISIKEATTIKYTSGEFTITSYSDGKTATATTIEIDEDDWVTLPAGTYTINVTPTCTDSSTGKYFGLAQVVVTGTLASTTPTLTGAWQISGEDVTSATVVQGSSPAPTVPTFTVGATSGTPTADDYSVAYSLKSGSTEGIFTFTADGGLTAISTATSGSATIVATLTTEDDTKFLTPETNTFEYTVTVSAAEAPTINVSGAPAGDVLVGTEVTLTANVTGFPTPTITWYNNSNDEQVGTGETFTVPTNAAGTFVYYASADNGVGEPARSENQTIVVKEKVATPTFDPNGAYFQDSQEVTLACTTAGATIKYSTDDGATWTDYTAALTFDATTTVQAKAIKDGYIDSDVATATFTKVTLDEQTDVTGAMTWDWSEFGTKEIKLTDATTPKKTDEFVLSNVFAYGLTSAAVPAAFGDAQALKVTCEYPVRDSKYLQGGYIKFNTTVIGKLEITYSNTGNRSEEDDRRFLNVNGVNYGDGTMSTKTTVTTEVPAVAAGEVVIKGTLKKDGSDQYLRIYKIVFTPITNVSAAISTTGWSTYCSPVALDFSSVSDLEAYIATGVEGTTVTTSPLEGSVPANTPLLLKGIAEAEYTIPVVASSTTVVTANKLVAGTGAAVAKEDGVTRYVLSANEGKAVFKMIDTTPATVPVGKAYLEIEISGNPPAPMLSFDLGGDTTGIRPIDNGQLIMDNVIYDLSGRRVENPTKGVYIMNGRKVVIK